MDIRIGNGFDVHAFEEGNFVILGGVKIPHSSKLRGHSDADVVLHAITDAIFGALAKGDIGTHFPPDDRKWKDNPKLTWGSIKDWLHRDHQYGDSGFRNKLDSLSKNNLNLFSFH